MWRVSGGQRRAPAVHTQLLQQAEQLGGSAGRKQSRGEELRAVAVGLEAGGAARVWGCVRAQRAHRLHCGLLKVVGAGMRCQRPPPLNVMRVSTCAARAHDRQRSA